MKRLLYLLLTLFCSLQVSGFSNPLDTLIAQKYLDFADSILFENQLDSAIIYFEKAANIYEENQKWDKYFTCYQGIAYCHHIQGSFPDFLKYEKKIKPHLDVDVASVLGMYNALATAYRRKEDQDNALKYYNAGLEKIQQFETIDSLDLATLLNSLGVTYRQKGDFQLSLEYYERAFQIYQNIQNNKPVRIAKSYQNIGTAHRYLENYTDAIISYKEALLILQNLPFSKYQNSLLIRVYHNLISCYNEQKDCVNAKKTLDQLFETAYQKHPDLPLIYKDLGINQLCQNQQQAALETFEKALVLLKKKHPFPHTKKATIYNQIAQVYQQKNDFKTALKYHQKSLNNLTLEKIDTTNFFQNPKLHQILSHINLLKSLKSKIQTLEKWQEQSNDIDLLKNIFQSYLFTDSLITQMRQSYKVEGSKTYLSQQVLPIYEGAIKTALQLYEKTQNPQYQEAAFTFAEKNKATILLESLKDNQAKFLHVPDSLIQEEKTLNTEIIYVEKKLYEAQVDTSKAKEKWQNQLFDLKRKKEQKRQQLAQDFPNYYKLKFDTKVASITDIQDILHKHQALIEYFVGDSTIYTFVITKKTFEVQQNPKPSSFKEDIIRYRKAMSDLDFLMDSTKVAQHILLEKGHFLYQWLLAKPLENVDASIQRLIIVPDDLLGYLNFETLLPYPSKDGRDSHIFLLQKYSISQAYSATLLRSQTNKKISKEVKTKEVYAGFAPTYPKGFTIAKITQRSSQNERLSDLPSARKAVQNIAQLMKGKQWIGKEASEDNFKKEADHYQLLHLAMHGVIDDKNPAFSRLIFTPNETQKEDGFLYANELYNLSLNADLAVLSACNTGVGQLKKGEGIMSLSRAFTYAGCPSLVMSLWSVPSKATSQLMMDFHQNLKEGNPIDEALRKAKLSYLEEASTERMYPYFWAGFIPIGNTQNILPKPTILTYSWIWLPIAFITLLIGFLLIKKRSKNVLTSTQ